MNKKQLVYQCGRIINEGNGCITFTTVFGLVTVANVATGRWTKAVVSGLITLYSAKTTIFNVACKRRINVENNEVLSRPDIYPLEHANEVIISDDAGLEHLLKRTRDRERKEWGTVLKTAHKSDQVCIYDILDSFEAERRGFVKKRRSCGLRLDVQKSFKEGYSGFHHYHTDLRFFPNCFNALDYSV